jgi:N-acetylneuraminic acid mutarotase
LTLASILVVASVTSTGFASNQAVGSASRTRAAGPSVAGTWRVLPKAPIDQAGLGFTSVWTGSRMIVFGGATSIDEEGIRTYAGAVYDPAADTWSSLPDLRSGNPYGYVTVWTGTEMVAFSGLGSHAYNPKTNRWRRLPSGGGFGGVLAWTGRELIAWGGGCCAEASNAGSAYNPTTNRWRKLAHSPLAPSQTPIGAWTGRELVILVTGIELNLPKRYPASFARAAAYNPRTNTWRRIAPAPDPRFSWDGATAIWDGREVLVVGGTLLTNRGLSGGLARIPLAYNPRTNRWRRLAAMESGRTDFAAVWTGKRLLVWGGRTTRGGPPQRPPRGFAYDPATNRWSRLPQAPLRGRSDPTAVWTGKAMIVWGGGGLPDYRSFTDGAAFTSAAP